MRVAVMGVPGVGKTTLAAALSAEFGCPVVSAGDIGRAVDPEAIARGDMADEEKLRDGMMSELTARPSWILDGFPRTVDQARMLPEDTTVINLTCRVDVARDRLYRRGRADDDTIEKRLREQSMMMEVDVPNGWAHQLAGYGRSVNTTYKGRPEIASAVIAHLRGEKPECY